MSRRFLRPSFITAMAVVSLTVLAAPVAYGGVPPTTTTRYVDDDGTAGLSGCDGAISVPTQVQTAVDSANPGNSVVVCPGTYVGAVKITTRNLTLRAAEPWTATIVAAPDHNSETPLIWIKGASSVTVKWLRLRAPTEGTCQPVWYMITAQKAPYVEIRSNNLGVTGNETLGPCGYNLGINLSTKSPRATIAYNTVTDFIDTGIAVASRKAVVLRNTLNFFHSDSTLAEQSSQPTAIFLGQNGKGSRMDGNVIRGLSSSGDTTPELTTGIKIIQIANPIIANNSLRYIKTGLELISTTGGSATGNEIHDNSSWGMAMNDMDNMTITNNDVTDGYLGITVNSDSSGNDIHDNDFSGHSNDCWDLSSGSGTGDTANFWDDNIGFWSDPEEICDQADPN